MRYSFRNKNAAHQNVEETRRWVLCCSELAVAKTQELNPGKIGSCCIKDAGRVGLCYQ